MDSNNSILDMEKDFEIKALRDEIERLHSENNKLRLLNKELGGDGDISDISDEEVVCRQEIAKLKETSDGRDLSTDEVKKFDLLVKNLKLIRGELKRGRKSGLKEKSTKELKKMLND